MVIMHADRYVCMNVCMHMDGLSLRRSWLRSRGSQENRSGESQDSRFQMVVVWDLPATNLACRLTHKQKEGRKKGQKAKAMVIKSNAS